MSLSTTQTQTIALPQEFQPESHHDVHQVVYKEIAKDFSFQDANRLFQCLLSGCYFLLYGYYVLQHTLYTGEEPGFFQRMNYFTSLATFLGALMLSDSDTMYKAIPKTWSVIVSIPGLQECISLIYAILWMVASIVWFINYPISPADTTELAKICIMNLPSILTFISFFNWFSWTCSFMY